MNFEDDDLERNDEISEEDPLMEEGCCFPDKCCMPGIHFKNECHTPEMYERMRRINSVN